MGHVWVDLWVVATVVADEDSGVLKQVVATVVAKGRWWWSLVAVVVANGIEPSFCNAAFKSALPLMTGSLCTPSAATRMKDRGRPKKTWLKNIRNDLFLLDLNENLSLNETQWRKRIHVANPTLRLYAQQQFTIRDNTCQNLQNFVKPHYGAVWLQVGYNSRFDVIGEHTGSGHNHNIMVPFGGDHLIQRAPSHNRLSCSAIWRRNCRSGGVELKLVDTFCLLVRRLQIRWRRVEACGRLLSACTKVADPVALCSSLCTELFAALYRQIVVHYLHDLRRSFDLLKLWSKFRSKWSSVHPKFRQPPGVSPV
ncbi:hypothetical protein IEQ34_002766 [Dendrobium chrysotoxum]|uniref:Uncharacterized protein n=1 Tax=Dendrobium chrysotoxum TaxID=161865 RepID=A0AAV7HJW3_DENCH|nr:hypothetical protein IEQ34_002766 [Dendrobium chrysotoxum]